MHPFKGIQIGQILILLSCIILLCFNGTNSQDEYDSEETETEMTDENDSCKKSVYNLLMGFINATLECLGGRLVLASIKELGSRFYCIVRCSMEVLGLMENGVLDEVNAVFFIQENIPESIRESVIDDAGPCLDLAEKFRPQEYYCPSYAPFTNCFLRSLLRTYPQFAINCFAPPTLNIFFGIIDALVPQPVVGVGGGDEPQSLLTGLFGRRNFRPIPSSHGNSTNRLLDLYRNITSTNSTRSSLHRRNLRRNNSTNFRTRGSSFGGGISRISARTNQTVPRSTTNTGFNGFGTGTSGSLFDGLLRLGQSASQLSSPTDGNGGRGFWGLAQSLLDGLLGFTNRMLQTIPSTSTTNGLFSNSQWGSSSSMGQPSSNSGSFPRNFPFNGTRSLINPNRNRFY